MTPEAVCAGIVVADVFVPPLERMPAPGELVATGDFVVETKRLLRTTQRRLEGHFHTGPRVTFLS